MTKILCIGLATSGLSPERDFLLEVCAVPLDRETLDLDKPCQPWQTKIVADLAAATATMDPKVFDMHEANGLIEAILFERNLLPTAAADAELAAWIDRIGAQRSPLFAFGAQWTRSWLRARLPLTEQRFGRESVDIGELARAAGAERTMRGGRAFDAAYEAATMLRTALRALKAGK